MDSLYGRTLTATPQTGSDAAFEPRFGEKVSAAIWLVWVAAGVALTVGPFAWHIDYFAKLGGEYRVAIVVALLIQIAATVVYVRMRTRRLWRWEPRILAAVGVAGIAAYEPLGLLVALLLWVVCFGAGSWFLDRFGIGPLGPLPWLGLASAAGLGLLVIVLFPIGLAGLYSPLLLAVLLVVVGGLTWRRIRALAGTLRSLDRAWVENPAFRSPLVGVAVAFAPAFLLSFLAVVVTPSIAYDAISHHLPAANHYLLGGQLSPLPAPPGVFGGRGLFFLGHSVAYSYYPQSFEELLTVAIALGGQPAAQLISPLTFVLSFVLAIAIGRRIGVSAPACIVGAAAAASFPFAHWTGAIVKNDFPLALFELAALYCVLRSRGSAARRWMLLSAFYLGLSFGVKHTALFAAIPLGVLLLNELRRQRRRMALALAMAVLFAASGLFWHVRTYLLTGNPTYPAGVRITTAALPAVDGSNPSRWTVHLVYPWIAHFAGQKVLESPTPNPLGFFLVFFGAGWLVMRRRERSAAVGAVLFFVLLYYLYWAYIWGVLRYALVPAILLAMLTAERVVAGVSRSGGELGRDMSRPYGVAAASVLAYCLAFALMPTLMLEVNAPQLAYLAGRLDRQGYLRAAIADYRAIEFLNRNLGDGLRALSIGDCATGYAVDPDRVRCIRYRGIDDEEALAVASSVREWRPDFLLVPASAEGEHILAALDHAPAGDPVYADELHRIYRLPGGGDGVAPTGAAVGRPKEDTSGGQR